MNYRIAYKKSVARDIRKISKKQVATLLRKIEQDLPEKADSCPPLTGKFAKMRKFRIGEYRVVFSIIGDTVLVVRISHRRDVYR